ncbi:MAG: hypothetical protein ACOYK8_10655 [Alphaproteobacteria bacterium]
MNLCKRLAIMALLLCPSTVATNMRAMTVGASAGPAAPSVASDNLVGCLKEDQVAAQKMMTALSLNRTVLATQTLGGESENKGNTGIGQGASKTAQQNQSKFLGCLDNIVGKLSSPFVSISITQVIFDQIMQAVLQQIMSQVCAMVNQAFSQVYGNLASIAAQINSIPGQIGSNLGAILPGGGANVYAKPQDILKTKDMQTGLQIKGSETDAAGGPARAIPPAALGWGSKKPEDYMVTAPPCKQC